MDQHTASKQIFLPLVLIIPKPSNNTWSNTLQTSKQTFLPLGYHTQPKAAATLGSTHYKQANLPSSWDNTQATILE